jgi:alkylation response protein AidB-like acyl-CoA dehydrogenase
LSRSTDIAALVAGLTNAPDDTAWRSAFRRGFHGLRSQLALHPAERRPAAVFEAAAQTARHVAERCLPLAIGLVMHLYPLCALRCVPLPWWSVAGMRRSRLLREIDTRKLILANAGSERRTGAHAPVTLTPCPGGLRVDGTYDYVSLADVADLVLFSAPLADSDRTIFCVAELAGPSVRVGPSRFGGSMRLSDTCSVSFQSHRVPPDHFLVVPHEAAHTCMAQYQRSWFQLLLGEAYLARIERLHRRWDLPREGERIASLNELSLLKSYALQLLDDVSRAGALESLSRVTAAIKLRISRHAQATASAIQTRDETAATELGYLQRQPTSDDRILESLRVCAASHS